MEMGTPTPLRRVRRCLFGGNSSPSRLCWNVEWRREVDVLERGVVGNLKEEQLNLGEELRRLREAALKLEQVALREDLVRFNATAKAMVKRELKQLLEEFDERHRSNYRELQSRIDVLGSRLTAVQEQHQLVGDVVESVAGKALRTVEGKYHSCLSIVVELRETLSREERFLDEVRGKLEVLVAHV
ncbi:hypothetical protein HOP50_02g17100 [Chloropicon primus]|uniref:Uncharacterized protein n=1 Tax=Chloropicon primus TaxID=1764295 RepID=A0A5B8MFH9_9CHLO|nr:hypothetical protein A3770_02p17140 [Chloropicon primus]UPQ98404.1 hypothetical protein HOP50_02g17100 [Chloropicon primus]|eukprot:QDZ19196.1 hypothetical protein A3770_02p17140 [Chloropicon primus]